MKKLVRFLAFAVLPGLACSVAAEPLSIETWFQGPRLQDVAISPDGRYVSLVVSNDSEGYIAVKDLESNAPPKPIFVTDPTQDIDPHSCGWVNAARLVCFFSGNTAQLGAGGRVTALVAMDPDGGNRRFLLSGGDDANPVRHPIRLASWRTDEPDKMLIAGHGAGGRNLAVATLNVNTDQIRLVSKSRPEIGFFANDGFGNVLFGGGYVDSSGGRDRVQLYARKSNSEEWKLLKQAGGRENDTYARLLSVDRESSMGHALLNHNGRLALFRVDLNDQKSPELIFAHETVDISTAITGVRGALLGVGLESSLLGPRYFDTRAAAIDKALTASFPDRWNLIQGMSDDRKVIVVLTASASEASQYFVLDTRNEAVRFEALGSPWPGLAKTAWPRTIGHLLTTSSGRTRELLFTPAIGVDGKAPLVVLTDGAQSTGGFEPASYYLASRGYAVLRSYLKPPDRGSLYQPQSTKDWNGAIRDELMEAVRWATQRPDVDPDRVCIVGRGAYGGYQALLAAAREETTFKCAASVQGLSDLQKPRRNDLAGSSKQSMAPGTSEEQVKRESPLERAAQFRMPVMLIEGSVHPRRLKDNEDGREMAAALAKADKPHELVLIGEFDDAYTSAVYVALDRFLAANLRGN